MYRHLGAMSGAIILSYVFRENCCDDLRYRLSLLVDSMVTHFPLPVGEVSNGIKYNVGRGQLHI